MNQFKATCCRLFGLALFLILHSSLTSQAQDVRPVSRTYAIENVRIVQAPGKVIESGTIVLANGVITAVGENVSIPVDALRISADSMTVYAGFIDGLSHTGIPKPKEEQNRTKEKDPGNPSYERAGITPYVSVREQLDPKEGSISSLRKLGFTLVQTAPYGRMMPGQTGLILLSGGDRMLLRDNRAVYATLQGARGVYPNTVIGVMAKFRELYRQASNARKDGQRYDQDPTNMMRPASDEVHEALYPVLEGRTPVLFSASGVKDIQRVMALQEELGFNVMLADVKQGWDLTESIKMRNVPVFLSLDLPEWKEEVQDSTNTVDDSKEALIKRQVEFVTKQYSLPAVWSSAGIPFGFSTNGAKVKDIHSHLVKMKEAGVSEDVLLAGLTTQPATILGVSGIAGTVETGKMANLVITDKSYFDAKAQVRYVFVEGQLFEYESKAAPKKKGDDSEGDSPIGKWSYVAASPGGDGTGTIEIKGNNGALSGTLTDSDSGYSFDLSNIQHDDETLSFDFMYSDGTNQIPISVSVTLNGGTFSGTVDAAGAGSFPITGEKLPNK